MSRQRRVISNQNLPTKMPVMQAITGWLFLEKINAPQLVYGVYYTLVTIVFCACAYMVFTDESVDIRDEKL